MCIWRRTSGSFSPKRSLVQKSPKHHVKQSNMWKKGMVGKCTSKLHYCFQTKQNCKLTCVLTKRDLSQSESLSWSLLPTNWNDLSLVIPWFPWHARPPHTGKRNKPHCFRRIIQNTLRSLAQELKTVICSCSLTKPSLDILQKDKIMSMISKGKLSSTEYKNKAGGGLSIFSHSNLNNQTQFSTSEERVVQKTWK